MAAMLVPLPETSSDSNTLVLGHYPASRDPMTNFGATPLAFGVHKTGQFVGGARLSTVSKGRPGPGYFDVRHMPAAAMSGILARTLTATKGFGMADGVLYEVSEGLATVTLNRPEAMNALDTRTKEALRDALRAAGADEAVRAVLLTGTGKAFCVGQDLKEHVGVLAAGGGMTTVAEHYNPITTALATMPKPVVAAVNGVAAGAGAGFALAADYRIAADTASFNTAFAGVALSADSGMSWTLPRLIGHARAADLLLFPRSVPAAEALELGLVHRVVPAAELPGQALALARRLAAGPTVAYASIKAALAFGAGHDLPETLAREDELQSRAGASQDHRAAVAAFLAKETPRYTGR
jgi:2-(1,2-epoxy-1,2-dihydrophenyl)acetyl-CoA isomerase